MHWCQERNEESAEKDPQISGFKNIMRGKIRVESPRKRLMQNYENACPYFVPAFAAEPRRLEVDAGPSDLRENPV